MTLSMLRTLAPGLIATLLWTSCNKESTTQQSESKQTPTAKRTTTATNTTPFRPGSSADFATRIQKMDLAELRELWTSIDTSDLTLEEKRARQCQIVERLSQTGEFDEAMKLISRYGQGLHREALVFSLLTKSPEPIDKMLERIRGPGLSEGDRNVLLRALVRNIGGPGGLAKVSALLATKPNLSESEVHAIFSGLGAGVDLARTPGMQYYDDPDISGERLSPEQLQGNYAAAEATLLSAMKAYPSLKDSLLNTFLSQARDVAPFQCWKTVLANYDTMTKEDRAYAFQELSAAMFARNPQSALSILESLRGREDIAPYLNRGVSEWARNDISAVETWFKGSDNHLTKPEADSLASGVARFMARDDNPAEGWKWVGLIEDPELKQKAEGQVWGQEKRLVQEKAESNPRYLIEEIVAGTAGHADYWIETAMNEWIAQDETGARKWYEDHAASLTPTQTEAVSLSYARLALKGGDVDMARKWAAQVVTPKMKTKIETEITKASGN